MTRSLAVLLVVLLLPACNETRPGPPPPPTDLRLTSPSFDLLQIEWAPPTVAVDGYELEGRAGSNPYERVHDELIPADVIGGTLEIDPEMPELVLLQFRIRSVRGGVSGPWSPEAVLLRGIRPPPSLSATLLPGAAIALAWTNASAAADQLWLERADADAFGNAIGPWSTLPVSFGATSYTDTTPHELVHAAYRVRYGMDGTWSMAAVASAGPVPLRAPADVVAALTPEGVRLSWTNRSEAATALEIRRWPDGTAGIETLAPDVANHLDPTITVWPSSRWAVIATAGTSPEQESEASWVGLAAFQVSGPDGLLRASTAPVPESIAIRRSGDGRFVYLGTEPDGRPIVVRQTEGGLVHQPVSVRQLLAPYLALDGLGRPHILGYHLPVTGQISVVHEWLGDAGWIGETLPEPPELSSSTHWGVDAAGLLQLLSGEAVCTPSTGAWACEAVPDPPGFTGWMFWRLHVSRDGTALLVGTYSLEWTTVISVATRPPGGMFTVENAPFDCGYNAEPRLLPDAGGDFGVVCHRNNPSNPPGVMDVHYAERRGGAWSALEPVGARTSFTSYFGDATSGLSRVHVWTSQGGIPTTGLELWSRGPDGWNSAALVPSGGTQQLIGHLDSGKVWLLAKPADYSFPLPREPFSLWEEQ